MTETYPDDASLLALNRDDATGVEYIPTGRSPYYLEFRRLVYRLLRAAERANDFRVYADGDLSVGVRAGRCVIQNTPIGFAGAQGVAVPADAATWLWLDAAGALQSGAAGFPADRSAFIPLARVTADAASITDVEDRRGEAFLNPSTPQQLGLTATAGEINQALDGIIPAVTAAALSTLAGGSISNADNLHTHAESTQDVAGEALFTLANFSGDAAATASVAFSLPGVLPFDTFLGVDAATGFLQQRHGYAAEAFSLVGVHTTQLSFPGPLTASQGGVLLGAAPCDGVIEDVTLSLGDNLDTTAPADGVALNLFVNGVAALDTPPQITVADGGGFRSTAQGHGTAAAVKGDDSAQVQRGDRLSLDLTRTVTGTLNTDAADAVALVVVRAAGPN